MLIFGGDLANQPFPIPIDLQGVPDGDYQLRGRRARRRRCCLRSFRVPVKLVAGLDEQHASVERAPREDPGPRQREGEHPLSVRSGARHQHRQARVRIGQRAIRSSGCRRPVSRSLYDFAAGMKKIGDAARGAREGQGPRLARGRRDRAALLHARGRRDSAVPRVRAVDVERQVGAAARVHPARQQPRPGFLLRSRRAHHPEDRRRSTATWSWRRSATHRTAATTTCRTGARRRPARRGRRERDAADVWAARRPPRLRRPRRARRGGATGFGGVNGSVTPGAGALRVERAGRDARVRSDPAGVSRSIRSARFCSATRPADRARTTSGRSSRITGPRSRSAVRTRCPATATRSIASRTSPMLIFVGGDDTPNITPSRTMVQALQQNGVGAVLEGVRRRHARLGAVGRHRRRLRVLRYERAETETAIVDAAGAAGLQAGGRCAWPQIGPRGRRPRGPQSASFTHQS